MKDMLSSKNRLKGLSRGIKLISIYK